MLLGFICSLGVGATLAAEVKRSLTVFNAGSENPVQTLFVSSDGEGKPSCVARLQEISGLARPVPSIRSLAGDAVQVDKATRPAASRPPSACSSRWAEKPGLQGSTLSGPKEPKGG